MFVRIPVILLVFLGFSVPVMAEISIIVGKPYSYKSYSRNYNYGYSERASNYSRRHNFGQNQSIDNPYLNRSYSIDRQSNTPRKILNSPSNNSIRLYTPNNSRYGYQRNYNYGYRQGYREGFQDGYNEKPSTSSRYR